LYNNKGRYKMNKFLAVVVATMVATSASADDLVSGAVNLDFAENAAGDWAGAMGVELDVNSAAGDVALGFVTEDGSALDLDTWTVGTTVAGVGVAIGDDNGVFVDAEGNHTLAAPAMTESVAVSFGGAAFAVGFTDWTSDITDISNVQGAYTLGVGTMGLDVTASADYNLDSENTVLGAGIGGVDLGLVAVGGAMTYDVDASNFAGELVVETNGITAYVNGDQDEIAQNFGAEYTYTLGGAEITGGGNYDVTAEEFKPKVGLSFNF
jgi:hypothetical protein